MNWKELEGVWRLGLTAKEMTEGVYRLFGAIKRTTRSARECIYKGIARRTNEKE